MPPANPAALRWGQRGGNFGSGNCLAEGRGGCGKVPRPYPAGRRGRRMLLHILHLSARPKDAPAHPPSLGSSRLRREAVAVATCRAAQGRGCSAQAWLPADRQTCLRQAMGSFEGRALLPLFPLAPAPPAAPPPGRGMAVPSLGPPLKGITRMKGDPAGPAVTPGAVASVCGFGFRWVDTRVREPVRGARLVQDTCVSKLLPPSLRAPPGAGLGGVGGLSPRRVPRSVQTPEWPRGEGGSRRAAAAVVFMLEKLG